MCRHHQQVVTQLPVAVFIAESYNHNMGLKIGRLPRKSGGLAALMSVQQESIKSAVCSDETATDHNRANVRRSSAEHHVPPSSTSHDTVAGSEYH